MNIAARLVEYVEQNRYAISQYMDQNIDWSSGDAEQIFDEYRRYKDMEEGDEIDVESRDYEQWFVSWAEDQYADAEWSINEGLRQGGGKITLYRCITAPVDWKPDPNRHPGIYWSWDKDYADAHWGEFGGGNVKWILETEVTSDAINWVPTLGQNGIPSYADEREVRLKDGEPVTITAYYPKK